MIHLNTVTFAYASGDEVLSGISLHLVKGALMGLAGANGNGKSTLLALMAGLYAPTKGSLEVAGRVSPGKEGDIRAVCRLVMQDADLQILGATVEEDLLLGRKRDETVIAEARDMARRFKLLKYWDKPVQTLSWGTKRKLCLAAALLDKPRVLLLDEPFSGLDYPGVLEMRAIIRENRQAGLTQVISSHDLESFIDIVETLAVLDGGKLVLNGPPHSVLDQVEAYGIRPPCSWLAGGVIIPWEGTE
ncbi:MULTISPECIES: ABC transporter ATP-binding protein [unclassified Pseudodesulfovibrio]|uniref:energy-coupling factor ABC transporter ATP-binding protein n=1 Tax=unclassified Pseudodesulfovibrio TaxID=2661612 RepID=UPI000FEBEB68|nr:MULTISPECIES: ABC transporter ATP-binding protein [unclassified Pseudodesulfovibrio]MCJ2164948.1 energy-coupling factor ABC transporter ATP-binding protein [Pseudodesulfovibrio sp. S3-i]RWU03607.1 ABC transporter ATP-binding protein [Pseudodesulfovibrio sp. S3]